MIKVNMEERKGKGEQDRKEEKKCRGKEEEKGEQGRKEG